MTGPATTVNMNPIRCGSFTSSEIFKLLSLDKAGKNPGDPYYTYIAECNAERKLNRSIDNELDAKPLTWGTACEKYFFNKNMSTEYKHTSSEAVQHPTIPYWVGSPEGNKFDEGKTLYEMKSPMTLKSFCRLVLPIYEGLTGQQAMDAIRNDYIDETGFKHAKHKDGQKYFWQTVSNSILTNSKYGELIVCAPYKSELEGIRDVVRNWGGDAAGFFWIDRAQDDELPWLHDNGYYKNINTIRFEVSQADKDKLTEVVERAGQLLIPYQKLLPEAE